MCGRIGQNDSTIPKFYGDREEDITWEEGHEDDREAADFSDNISHSEQPIVIINNGHKVLTTALFGFRPKWEGSYIPLNARCEGKDENKQQLNLHDDPNYAGPYRLDEMPMFKDAFKCNRCLIPVDHFIEGPKKEKLSEPYMVRRKDQKPFALGGIVSYDQDIMSFAIITTAGSPLLIEKVGHHRSPLVLSRHEENIWMDHEISLTEIKKLFLPFDDDEFEAIPIEANIKSGKDKIIRPRNEQQGLF